MVDVLYWRHLTQYTSGWIFLQGKVVVPLVLEHSNTVNFIRWYSGVEIRKLKYMYVCKYPNFFVRYLSKFMFIFVFVIFIARLTLNYKYIYQ